jgi:hypothetical protein
MRVIVVVPLALALLGGCLNWQSAYDSAARKECRAQVNAEERQDCLTGVEGNSSESRIDSHS